ncbi:MAG: TIGR03960 family B12-binding radical SAM protein [Nitrospirae bacterium]|nr:TIGR03960 family B12-binding radical SAM protein [Nitrospirota bacterium]
MNFSLFQKPSRYINSEINSLRKEAEIKVALAFPDTYEVGMSHLGTRVLYKIINDLAYASAERAFQPWPDMEGEMKYKGVTLYSLETKRPLKDFDIVGFSLQHELCYTTVLNMLSLSGIPLHAEERGSCCWPLIIAGGPCTVNPLPMSVFIDAFLIGDGEEAIVEILDTYKRWKREGDGRKESILKSVSAIKGMYVPTVHGTQYTVNGIKRRFIESLDSAPYPESPIVPYSSIVHDRVNLEISRGCTMGCRFCQAGMIYRPLREKSPDRVLELAEKSLRATGYEEVSFTSLSAGDYSSLLLLLREFNRHFSDQKISLSLPSLRVAAVNKDILREIKSVRKTGFTIAPEAATERLRNVINKNFTLEDYEQSLKSLFEEGWHNLKLYFMIGLPTETGEDIEEITNMALKALRIAKMNTGRYVNLSITISPFVPKAHTPFQWYGQQNINEIKKKSGFLKEIFYKKGLKFKGHNEDQSLLEAVFARGDERLAALIEKAWSFGCRLDPWTEAFDYNRWIEAMDKTGINARDYAEKTFGENEQMPWNIIDTGIEKKYLYREYQKAISSEVTSDCRKTCHACGLKCKEVKNEELKVESSETFHSQSLASNSQVASIRLRAEFSKTGSLKYLSHLEMITAMFRAMRRAEIPLVYSQGFHPAPKVSFGPALSVGITGMREYFDIGLKASFDSESFKQKMNCTLPKGLRIREVALVPAKEPSLSGFISRYEYEIICDNPALFKPLSKFNRAQFKHKNNVEDIYVIDENTVRLILVDQSDRKARISEIIQEIFNVPYGEFKITRLSMYGWKSGWVKPLEWSPICLMKS